VSHCGLAILPRQKEELWKFKYFTMQKYNLQKKSLNSFLIFNFLKIY